MARLVNVTDSIVVNPSGYTGLTNLTTSTSQYPISNGYTDTSSTTYARFTTTYNSAGYCYYTFTINGIPSGATITSVTAQVKVRINNTGRVSNTSCQLYSGTTAKGNSGTFSSTSSSNVVSLNNTGSWTISELENLRVRIAGTGSNQSNSGYIYFYGANITINYSYQGYEYTIAATSMLQDYSASPASQEIMQGGETTIRIDGPNLDDVAITDNDIDIISSLVRHNVDTSGSVSKTADSFTTGFSGGSSMNFYTSSSSTTNNFSYAVGHTAESPGATSSGSGSWTYVKDNGSSTNYTGYADFIFDFSDIPENAIISTVEIKCYGAVEDSSQTTSHADISLFSGNTQKGTTQKFTSSTNSIITISDPGTWTRAELQSAKLRFAVGYYGGHIFGITWNVSYTIPVSNPYYWTYTISNIAVDHIILIDEIGVFIPPEEDPEYTYYSLTISSINAATTPTNGTTRVVEGSNQTITITPTDPTLTLALDNGVDVTSQLQGGIPSNTYTVTTQVSGASYGFNLNSSTGYYVSTNNGVAKSASVARINMDFESSCVVTIQYINYAEANYDYGMFGKLDTAVATDGLTANNSSGTSSPSDSTSNYQLAMASNNSGTQTITYNVPAGQHFIDVKYGKDDATDSNNDTLQWKVLSVEATSAGGAYTYTLSNIQANHSLIFVFGDVTYWFVNSTANCRIFPDGQSVKLDMQPYSIKIVPNAITDTVTLTDNGVAKTIEREDGFDKDNNPAVSYTYTINQVTATHNLIITSTAAASTNYLFIKQNGGWINILKVYKKIDNRWEEQNLSYMSDNHIQYLKQG